VTLRRVIRDDGLDSLGFDVELANQSGHDFFYDPESLAVRVGDEVYPEAVSDAAGIVEVGKTLPAFFVVAGTAAEGRNDLAVTNQFDVVMRRITGEKDSKVPIQRKEPADAIPTAQSGSEEPTLQTVRNGRSSERSMTADQSKPRKSHGRKRKSSAPPGENYAAQPNKKERSDEAAAQADE
jgi:hypothetical protein